MSWSSAVRKPDHLPSVSPSVRLATIRSTLRESGCPRSLAGAPGSHTVVSLLLDLGTPPHVAQVIARHAHIDVTMAIYAHTNLDAMRQALDAIEWEDL
jgi:hypothetical protein